MNLHDETENNEVPFEEALDKAGFGLYSYSLTCFSGFAIIACCCVVYGTTFIIPTSACELETTTEVQGFLAAAPVVGLILGALLWGYLGDVYGRRIPLFISLISSTIVNLIACISVNWIMLMILQFIASFLASGQYSLSMTLLCESVPMIKRNIVLLLVSSIFMMTQGLMAVLAIPIIPLSFSYYLPVLDIYWNSWRTLMVVYSLPCVISTIWLLWLMESPKFLYNKGRFSEALDVLVKIHRSNNRWSSEKYNVKGILNDIKQNNESSSAKEQIVPLFTPPLLKYTIIMISLLIFQQVGAFLTWLPTIANQLFRIIETGEADDLNLCRILEIALEAPPDPDLVPCALNFFALLVILAIGAIMSIFNASLSLIVNRFGRRNMAICIATVCGACGVITNLVPNAVGSVILFIIFLNGFVVLGLYNTIVVAIFPTSVRAMAVAVTSTGGLIGSVVCIQILNILLVNNCDVGFYIFTGIFTSSGLVALLLEDDRYLPDAQDSTSIEEKTENN